MQPIKQLGKALEELAVDGQYLFAISDFYALFPEMSIPALRVLLARAAKSALLIRFCNGLYLYPKGGYSRGFELYHAAARLREDVFCYLSLESVLSESGVLSQIPLGRITLMTTGRSGIISCGEWGKIEFVHTKKRMESIVSEIQYDKRCKLWRASVKQALRDAQDTHRSLDLIDWEAAREFV
jgi:predicted transcriptional regulator of viral defense system